MAYVVEEITLQNRQKKKGPLLNQPVLWGDIELLVKRFNEIMELRDNLSTTYANDTAAKAGGVEVGGVYLHTSGAIHIVLS